MLTQTRIPPPHQIVPLTPASKDLHWYTCLGLINQHTIQELWWNFGGNNPKVLTNSGITHCSLLTKHAFTKQLKRNQIILIYIYSVKYCYSTKIQCVLLSLLHFFSPKNWPILQASVENIKS